MVVRHAPSLLLDMLFDFHGARFGGVELDATLRVGKEMIAVVGMQDFPSVPQRSNSVASALPRAL